jgi:hypothetical protein
MPERFEILTAGFYLFVQAWRRPFSFIAMLIGSLVLLALLVGAFLAVFLPLHGARDSSGELPPEVAIWMVPTVIGILIAMFLFFLAFYAGWNRFLVGAKLPFLFPFRLGADEGRSFVVAFVHWALLMGVYLILVFVMVFAMLAITLPSGFDESGSPNALPGTMGAVTLGFYLVFLFGGLMVAVKFLPAYAMTILEKRIVIFDSWNVTKGVFWSAFVSTLIPLGVVLVLQGVTVGIQMATVGAARLEPSESQGFEAFAAMGTNELVTYALTMLGIATLVIIFHALPLGPYAYMAVWHDRNRQYREPQMAPLTRPNSE